MYSHKRKVLTEVTLGNRGGLDATDPGGRLGPFVDQVSGGKKRKRSGRGRGAEEEEGNRGGRLGPFVDQVSGGKRKRKTHREERQEKDRNPLTTSRHLLRTQGEPDLRNFRSYFCFCEKGDSIIVCSDGVHDNLDPLSLGKV